MNFETPKIKSEHAPEPMIERSAALIQREGELLDKLPDDKITGPSKGKVQKWFSAMTLASALSSVLTSAAPVEARGNWHRVSHEVVSTYGQIEQDKMGEKERILDMMHRDLERLQRDIERTIREYDRDIREAHRDNDADRADQMVKEREEKVGPMEEKAAELTYRIGELEKSLRKQGHRLNIVRSGIRVLGDVLDR